MKLKELLDAVNLKDFNLDVIGMHCHWSNSEHTDITYSGEIVHDYYCPTKDMVDTKFLEYTIVDISGFDDGLSITIEHQEEKEVKTETPEKTIKKLEAKVQELQNICFEFSQAAYQLLGEFSDDSALNVFELVALKNFKSIIDKNIANKDYKEYLKHRYVEKDLEAINKQVVRVIKEVEDVVKEHNNTFVRGILVEDYAEDDTETFSLKED